MSKKAKRINIYLNEDDPKDYIIINFLNKRYSETGFIKETLYSMATGSGVNIVQDHTPSNLIQLQPLSEEYEDIQDSDNIEL